MTTNEIRRKFLEFSEKKLKTKTISSSLLVPENDPTTLFTGSGMQPMVPYLLGEKHPLGTRIADSQKCFRSQDIEEVGDNRHTTFFEMLGDWSLGDFFKDEQIDFMWEFLTEEIKLDPARLYFSCFKGNKDISKDDFSALKWQGLFQARGMTALIGENPEEEGMKEGEKIFYYGDKKNWWSRAGVPANMPVGEPGGPDTEMFFDFYPELGRNCIPSTPFSGDFCHVNCDCGRFIEIGNNVFMEYIKTETGFEKLKQQNVDFGGGLERITAAVNNDSDVFNIDVFSEAKKTIKRLSDVSYEKNTYAYRVILDHLRAAVFLIGDGVMPGSKDQMYFVRRLLRRAVRFASNLNIKNSFTREVGESFINVYKDEYSALEEKKDLILSELQKEEDKFRKTLENGLKEFSKILSSVPEDTKTISGEMAFNLLQTYGFPVELTEELAAESNMKLDMQKFLELREEHIKASRLGGEAKFKGGLASTGEMETKYHTATHMLHEALREVLGETVAQKGSNITPERLRFDFSFERKMTDEEKIKVEDIINSKIKESLDVIREEISYDEARARGAIGLFDDKYSDMVSIYKIGKGTKRGDSDLFSMEFCGGPHVTNTSLLGVFEILKEESVSTGVRRIKAVLK